jgi:hypothetical protein
MRRADFNSRLQAAVCGGECLAPQHPSSSTSPAMRVQQLDSSTELQECLTPPPKNKHSWTVIVPRIGATWALDVLCNNNVAIRARFCWCV